MNAEVIDICITVALIVYLLASIKITHWYVRTMDSNGRFAVTHYIIPYLHHYHSMDDSRDKLQHFINDQRTSNVSVGWAVVVAISYFILFQFIWSPIMFVVAAGYNRYHWHIMYNRLSKYFDVRP